MSWNHRKKTIGAPRPSALSSMEAGCDAFGGANGLGGWAGPAFPSFCQATLVAGSRPPLNGDSAYVVGGRWLSGWPPMTSRFAGVSKRLEIIEKRTIGVPRPSALSSMEAGCDAFGGANGLGGWAGPAFPSFCQATLVAGSRPPLNGDSAYVVGGRWLSGWPPMTSRFAGVSKRLEIIEKRTIGVPRPSALSSMGLGCDIFSDGRRLRGPASPSFYPQPQVERRRSACLGRAAPAFCV